MSRLPNRKIKCHTGKPFSSPAMDRAEIKLLRTAFCERTPVSDKSGNSEWHFCKDKEIHRDYRGSELFTLLLQKFGFFFLFFSFAVAHNFLLRWPDRSHYTFSKCFLFSPASSFAMHAELSGGRNPSLRPYRSFSHPSLLLCLAFPWVAAHPCLDFVHQINRGTYCDWTSQWKVNFNPSD